MSIVTPSGRRVRKQPLDRDKTLLITTSVPVEKSFHFFTDIRKPIGVFSTSIFEFADQLKKVDVKSLEFHLKRNDFTNWLREVVKDDALAHEFEKLQQVEMTGEKLRERLVRITEKRCRELADALKSIDH